MTKPNPKPLGSTIEVDEGVQVIRPGGAPEAPRTITGGVYVFDVPGTHTIGDKTYEVSEDREPEAQPKP